MKTKLSHSERGKMGRGIPKKLTVAERKRRQRAGRKVGKANRRGMSV